MRFTSSENEKLYLEGVLKQYEPLLKISLKKYVLFYILIFVALALSGTFFFLDEPASYILFGITISGGITAYIILAIRCFKISKAKQKYPEIKRRLELLNETINQEKVSKKDTHNNLDKLLDLKKLLDLGVITQEEFNAKKKELL